MDVMELLLYLAAVFCLLLGIAGAVVPIVPGPVLGLVALLAHKLVLGSASVSWTFLTLAAVAVTAAALVDLVLCGTATRWFGGTRQGVIGAVCGLLGGLLLLGPVGLLVGPVIGAVLFEWIEQRSLPRAARAGVGAIAGVLAATLARVAVACGLLAGFLATA